MKAEVSHQNEKPSQKLQQFFTAFSAVSMQQGIQEITQCVLSDQNSEAYSPISDFINGVGKIVSSLDLTQALDELQQNILVGSQRKRGIEQRVANSVFIIANKSEAAIFELNQAFNEIEVQQNPSQEHPEEENNHIEVKLQTQNDNEFMGQEFGSLQKLEEVKKYCDELKTETVQNYINETEQKQKKSIQATQKICHILETSHRASVELIFNDLINWRPLQSQNRQSDNQRPSTGQIIKGSAHSQRIKSASKKGSDAGSDQFQFDLTAKTRNSKNAFKSLIKQDSLMYSAQSDFGYHPSSPKKENQKVNTQSMTENKHLQKIEDTEEDPPHLKNVDKSQSEEYEPSNYEGKTENVQDGNLNQNDHDHDFEIPSNLSHRDGKKSQNNSPKQDRSVEQHIEDYNDGFQADDEDPQIFESARYAKKDPEKIFKKRVGTEVAVAKNSLQIQKKSNNIKFNKVNFSKVQKISHSSSQANIFTTQISNYQSKIAKLKEVKELKKKKLEEELAKVNHQIQALHKKEEQMSPHNNNHYASRAKISDNVEAKKRAESLVKNLRSQKRSRNIAKIGQFKSLDRNINDYMEELTKLRAQNEEKMKQKKKLQILERMKQHQIRKMNDRKKIQESQNFVMHLKSPIKEHESPKRSRISEKQEEAQIVTPQLAQKKAYLNKIRSFSVKKSKRDVYEQVLS